MQVIPSIDILGGRCVRLEKGDFRRVTIYPEPPSSMAKRFVAAGAQAIHVVDLDGAKSGSVVNWQTLEQIGALIGPGIQIGGGIHRASDIERLREIGFSRVVIGSSAIRSPRRLQRWVEKFGPDRFCVALDVKNEDVMVDGWRNASKVDLQSLIERLSRIGIRRFLSTDVSHDGVMEGPNLEHYRRLTQRYPSLEWIASGGVRSTSDIEALRKTGVGGVIVGKAFYEGHIKLETAFAK